MINNKFGIMLGEKLMTKDEMEQWVDESILQQMIKDTGVEVIPFLIEHYLKECELRLSKIQLATIEQNLPALEFESHTLGSTSLALGNRRLSELARKIEKHCLIGEADIAFSLIPELEKLAHDSIRALIQRKALGF
ncbi:Hpt domain-containing protein [Vibrio aestuarianus]|uniref:Hpt domain-containing protein n=1 Tax=Vibrio aestuarianus TaxID=28171 RepID=UPI00237CC841|nr:Hpt domain-containing protein [Vibrio aestuarianus]MDE1349468.1 Hpt domain-containing protein [Vibrio aestuarianus]